LPQRSLIGPAIFPFYSLTLVRVLPIVIFWSAVVRGIQFVASGQATVAHATLAWRRSRFAPIYRAFIAVGILATTSTYFVAAGAGANAHTVATVNHWVGLSFRMVFVLALFGFMKEVWEYAKRVRVVRQTAF
jgi:hypothetical protein